jgi:hypothetical protein
LFATTFESKNPDKNNAFWWTTFLGVAIFMVNNGCIRFKLYIVKETKVYKNIKK